MLTEETEKMLRDLAAKLGTTTEHLYGVLVKQSKVRIKKATLSIIFYLLIATVLWAVHGKMQWDELHYKYIHHNRYDYDLISEEDMWPVKNIAFVISLAVSIIWSIITLFAIKDDVEIILESKGNPEYNAVQDIIYTIRGED